jgi:hypothetical protein
MLQHPPVDAHFKGILILPHGGLNMKIKDTYNPEDLYDLLIGFTFAVLAMVTIGRLIGVC